MAFRNKNDLSAHRNPNCQRQEASFSAHDFHDEDAFMVMAVSRILSISATAVFYRGVKSDGFFGSVNVVVYGGWDSCH